MRPIVIDTRVYVAPRIQDLPRKGREKRTAVCGHEVWLGKRGLEAVEIENKQLWCDKCLVARASEHGVEVQSFSTGP